MILKFNMSPMTPANFLTQIHQIFFTLEMTFYLFFSKAEFSLERIKKKLNFLELSFPHKYLYNLSVYIPN